MSALKANGVEIKKNTFRNWIRDYKPDKLRENKISYEYIARFTLDGKDAKKYITTRGDVLNLNLGTVKYPQHMNDFMVVINGERITGHRGYLVYKYFIDSNISDFYNPHNELFYVNGLYEDCDISNIMRKSDLE